jgi:very-short-patch-repair endonuclease
MKASHDIRKRRPGATARARQLRRDETDAEYKLWYRLRGREIGGYKFVRQVPLGPYVVDFLCRSKRLIVEIDGEQHVDSERDASRTVWLNRHGYSVLRFWNHEALREKEAVLDTILAALEGQITAPSPGLRFAPADLSPLGRGTEPTTTVSKNLEATGGAIEPSLDGEPPSLPVVGERSSRLYRNDTGRTGEGADK